MTLSDFMQIPDRELAQRAQAGSLESFEEIVFRYESRILHFLRCRMGDTRDAEELAQDTFVAAYRNIHRYNPRYALATWLYTIARRKAISRLRAQPPEQPLADVEPVDTRNSSTVTEDAEEGTRIWDWAARSVSEPQFTALWLRYGEDLSIREVAKAMGKTVPHAKVLLHRGRRALARVVGRGSETWSAEKADDTGRAVSRREDFENSIRRIQHAVSHS
jgi:RNA polymerase sigma-70 factor (ECF subfamily)